MLRQLGAGSERTQQARHVINCEVASGHYPLSYAPQRVPFLFFSFFLKVEWIQSPECDEPATPFGQGAPTILPRPFSARDGTQMILISNTDPALMEVGVS